MYCLVSIIIPAYNTAVTLSRCIESVLSQTWKNIEIIIVDDGSSDQSPFLCDEYAVGHKSIRCIHKINGGLSSARLAGFEASSGEYILFVDSDDYIDPKMVSKMVHAIHDNRADLCLCSYFRQNGSEAVSMELPYGGTSLLEINKDIRELYVKPLMGHERMGINIPGFLWIRLLKRSLIHRSFFVSEREYYLEDHVFDLLYAVNVKRISIVNIPLYHYCINPLSLTNKHRIGKWKMYQKLYAFFNSYAKEHTLSGIEERMFNFLSNALQDSVDNAVRAGNYKAYRKELDGIITSKLAHNILREKSRILEKTHRLTATLCYFRCYWLLYLFRRWRLGLKPIMAL